VPTHGITTFLTTTEVNVCPYYNAEKQFDAPFTSIEEDQHDFLSEKIKGSICLGAKRG